MTSNTFGTAPPAPSTRSPAWLWPFAPMAVGAFSLSALVFFHVRHDGFEVRSALQHAYAAIYRTFGFAPSVMFFGLVVLWSTIWLVHGRLDRPLQRLGRLAAMAVLLGVLLNLGVDGVAPALHKGALGAWLAGAMVAAVGPWPSLVIVWGFTFASLLLATDFFFHESFERMLAAGAGERAPTTATVAAAPGDAAPTSAPTVVEPVAAAEGAGTAADEAAAWRRRSYYERRAERVAAAARWSEASDDAKAAPVDPAALAADAAAVGEDLSAARVVAAIDAAEVADGVAVAPEEAEALDQAGEATVAAAAAIEPAGTPIVFPDEFTPPAAPASADAVAAADAAVEWSAAAALGDVDERAGEASPVAEPAADVTASEAPAEADGTASATAEIADTGEIAEFAETVEVAETVEIAETSEIASGAEPALAADPSLAAAPTPTPTPEPEVEPAAAASAGDPIVTIPRPDLPASRPGAPDEALMREAIELVLATRRANAVFLQRKLRVDYDLAAAVLVELAARGIVALDAEATHGRILV
jgi:hypothetical protein